LKRFIPGMFLALICAQLNMPSPIRAQAAFAEYQHKAVYMLNFLKFVEFPYESFGDSVAPIVIGVVGTDPFGPVLQQVVEGKVVQGRNLVVRNYHMGEDMRRVNILFISASERKHLPQILASLQGSGVLTLADLDGFLEQGGMVLFQSNNGRARFAINLGAASLARAKISSKLLSLAVKP